MNKKEVLEIRKQFTPANCAITRIAGCYVDHEKNKRWNQNRHFYLCLRKRRLNILTFLKDTFRDDGEKYVEYGIPDRPGDARRDTGIFNETKSQ